MIQCLGTWAQLLLNCMVSAGLHDLELRPDHALGLKRVLGGSKKGPFSLPLPKDFLDLGTLTQRHLFFLEEFPNGFY